MGDTKLVFIRVTWDGAPTIDLTGGGDFVINGEVETKPEAIVKALSEIAIAWGNETKAALTTARALAKAKPLGEPQWTR